MAFGNPYDEPWGAEIVEDTLVWLKDIGVRTVSLADTVGTASPEDVAGLYRMVKNCVAGIEIGVHLHSRPDGAPAKVLAAYEAGCRRFDGALTGLGGCPFAGDHLVGNIATEAVLATLAARGVSTGIDAKSLAIACALTDELREKYAREPEAPQPNRIRKPPRDHPVRVRRCGPAFVLSAYVCFRLSHQILCLDGVCACTSPEARSSCTSLDTEYFAS